MPGDRVTPLLLVHGTPFRADPEHVAVEAAGSGFFPAVQALARPFYAPGRGHCLTDHRG
ncbi:hypothetical protein [Nonomuraea thailandensis]|uniref:hypothetical protein n=1 Tax=Nonomuraea thailandensis TaxID=1188745 RepID=UPI0020A2DC15|nr:hypothetical protein [Nonomuraea thailandensis]